MSKDTKVGISSRKIMTVMAAALAVAIMLAVPLFAAVDTDADITATDAGFELKMENPTQEQLTTYGVQESKLTILIFPVINELGIFNQTIMSAPVLGDDPYSFVEGWGEKMTADSKTSLYTDEVSADTVKMTLTVDANGNLISPYVSTMNEDYKAAAAAISSYLGENVSAGDKIEITGKIKSRVGTEMSQNYKLLDGDKCVIKQDTTTYYVVDDIDLEIKLIKSSETKSIRLINNVSGMQASDWSYEYSAEPVVPGTTFTAKNTVTNVYSGDIHFEVDGTNFTINKDQKKQPDDSGTAAFIDQSDIGITYNLQQRISELPAGTTNVTVDKTYESVNDEFSNIVMDAVGNDIMKILLIAGGVIIGIILLIAIIIIILVVKKSRRK